MQFPIDDILQFISQRPPFVMVEKLLSVNGNSARSSFCIKENNVFVKNKLFQEGGLLENMAQTAALGIGYMAMKEDKPITVGYIGAVKDLEIYNLPEVNDELITETTVENKIFNAIVISGRVWHNENLLAQCEMKVFMKDE